MKPRLTRVTGGNLRATIQRGSLKPISVIRPICTYAHGLPALAVIWFFTALFWAQQRDPLTRIEISLQTFSHGHVRATALLSKPAIKCPPLIYLHGSGENITTIGHALRQIAQLGLAAVSLDYNETNQPAFDDQFTTLHNYLNHQPWIDPSSTSWLGYNFGAQKALTFALTHPEYQPQLLILLAGGTVPELSSLSPQQSHPAPNLKLTTILLVRGDQDDTFPLRDPEQVQAALRRTGFPVTLRILPGQGPDLQPNRDLVFRVISEYCSAHLKAAPQRSISKPRPAWPYAVPPLLWAGLLILSAARKNRRCPVPPTFLGGGGRGEGFPTGSPAATASASSTQPLCRLGPAVPWFAATLFTVALLQTALRLGIPHLGTTEASLKLARRVLVQNAELPNFDYLAAKPIWPGTPLRVLLQHLELVSYNRHLVNWTIDDKTYRDFVLSPIVTGSPNETFNWRRLLWENLYLRISKEQAPESAADIVVRHLREQVTISGVPDPHPNVEAIWSRHSTDQAGFEAIYVAAMRSVGIPARLNSQGTAELQTGRAWQPAPRPLISIWQATPDNNLPPKPTAREKRSAADPAH